MYNEFSTVNIQIDKDFSAKLSGYGCIGLLPEADLSNASPVSKLDADLHIFVSINDDDWVSFAVSAGILYKPF